MSSEDVLKEIFGSEEKTESTIPFRPSSLSQEVASQAIQNINLSPVLRDIGMIVGREVSMALESMSLRPADYLDLPDMPKLLASRVGAELSKAPAEFVKALIEQMALRG